ncbi:efflux RND transporter permease subunit [Paraburkholderia elongata]|uniref:MMPL family transporter n=1 Tax=Paraburkholderia elongata TaxID=2675747 RepID=A0A972SHW6_9BURK|nr:MMPL family transporter [Paraburkholderia elongata]NPT53935.1 MMPL family transporter [Paraburkholderia elongata]
MAGKSNEQISSMPVVRERSAFDSNSGNALERLVFNHRLVLILLCAVLSVFFGIKVAIGLQINASFEKMIPQSNAYIRNYLANKGDLKGLGNSLRIVVENTQGNIYDPAYLEALRKINDAVFLMPGVDRPWVKSIWMPAVRWNIVTEKGYAGGPVMPSTYNGSPAAIDALRTNIARAGITGSLVANDLKSSMIVVPLLERDAAGNPINYGHFSHLLDDMVRTQQHGNIRIHVVGFAKLIGDLIDGLKQVMTYFGIAATIALGVIFFYTRCPRSTFLVVACSLVAVLWQLGIVTALGLVIDPYSVLVPFLVFAIGVSHGAQKMNGILQDVGRGTHKYVAARYTFRRLFLAGLTALMADMVGFAVLTIIDIPVIKDLALTASIGVGVLVFTNLLLLPVLLSYVGVSPAAAQRTLIEEAAEAGSRSRVASLWDWLDRFTERRWASGAIVVTLLLAVAGFAVSQRLQIGDLDAGAPELRADSVYNRDNAFINAHYGLSSDMFVVIGKSSLPNCDADHYQMLADVDRLEIALQNLSGVQTTSSAASLTRLVTSGAYEGYPKWFTINRTPSILNRSLFQVLLDRPDLISAACNTMPIIAYLTDHKAATLNRVLDAAQRFADAHKDPNHQFLLAAGSAGIDAATNIVVKEANERMLLLVYAAVVLLCLITFRSWRAAVVALVPLVITSVLCQALMVMLGIGVKVATLPVIALGVGIGVDYALYLLSVQLNYQRAGLPLRDAYRRAVQFTGKVVALVGVTLAAGVVTWAWSPIKFQADMGILLTFMFVTNMIGALILIPSLSHFLLRNVSSRPGHAALRSAIALVENSKGA